MTTALILVGLALAGMLALAALPLRLWLRAQGTPARVRLALGLAGGAVPWLTLIDTDRPRRRRKAARQPKPAKPSRRPSRRVWGELPGLVLDALALVRIERMDLIGRLGLGDPALTGEMYGRLQALRALGFVLPANARLQIEPVFDATTLDGSAEVIVSLVPIRLVPLGWRLAWALR